jgi:Zn-dependent protease
MRYLIYGAMVLLALRLVEPLALWWRVRQTRFRHRVRADKADPTTFPPELAPIFAEAASTMAAMGFEPSHAQWTDALVVGDQRRPSGVFVHRETCTFAEVCPPIFQNGRRLYCVAFSTFFERSPSILTIDGLAHLTPILPADTDVHDHCLYDVAAQWDAHRRALAERPATDTAKLLTPSTYMRAQCDAMAAGMERGRAEHVLEQTGNGACSLTPRAAWDASRALRAGARRIADAERSRTIDTSAAADAWAAADLYAFAYAESNRPSPRTPRARMQLFAISLALSAAALALVIGWAAVPGLLIVLLLHELGHVAGMRMFGYRDTQILFVPFLGAAAIGRKENASPAEKLIVLLMGPVPGIVLGMIALHAGTSARIAWLQDAGLLAVVLNYLNLLPFTPLDGGRIVDVLLLHRYPRAGVAFLLTSTVAAGLAGIVAADPFLTLLSMTMLGALPGRWLVGAAAAHALRQLGRSHRPRPERIRAAFDALQSLRRPIDAGARVGFAKAIMEHLDAPSPPRSFAVAGAALYGTLLVAPIVGTAMILVPDPAVADLCALTQGQEPADFPTDYGHALIEVCADPAFPGLNGTSQWKTLVDRAGHRLAAGDSTSAIQYFRLAHNAAVLEFDDDDPRRVATRKLVQELAAAEAARALAAAAVVAADTAKSQIGER